MEKQPESIFAPHELYSSTHFDSDMEGNQLDRSRSPTPPRRNPNCLSRSPSSDVSLSSSPSFYNHGEENQHGDDVSVYSTHDDSSMTSGPSHTSAQLMFKVQFKSTTDDFYLSDSCTRDIAIGDYVKVEADRGHDVGTVSNIFWPTAEEIQSLAATNNKQILAIATEDEFLLSKGKARDEARALSICEEIVSTRGMQISLVDAEYQYDRKKLTFFFTSDGHTDFRELVRDLFTIFKTRIWMQKIKPFEAVAFQNANAPIPRFNGGSTGQSSSSGRQSRRQQNLGMHSGHNDHGNGRYTSRSNTNSHSHVPAKGKSSFSSANNTSTDIYRTQLHLQAKHVTSSGNGHSLLKQATQHMAFSYLDNEYNHHPHNHQGHRDHQRRDHQQPYFPRPQHHHPKQRSYPSPTQQHQQYPLHFDPSSSASSAGHQSSQPQYQQKPEEYTSFSSYVSRISGEPCGS